MANVIDLTTVAAVENVLAQSSTADSSIIQTFITNYSQSVLTRTGRRFLSGVQTYSERYSGNGSQSLGLKNYPILSVASLTVNGIAIPQSPDYLQSGWAINTDGSQSFLSLVGGNQNPASYPSNDRWGVHSNWGSYGNAPPLGQQAYSFYQGIMNVAVSYVAGYTQNAYSEQQTVPASSPYTVAVNSASTFYADDGVTLANGTALTATTGTPAAGQYVAPVYGASTPGIYTFNAAQAGEAVNISYSYGAPPLDLQQAASELVALQYRRRGWIGQTSVVQPGIGTTAYTKMEMELLTSGIIDRYRDRRVM